MKGMDFIDYVISFEGHNSETLTLRASAIARLVAALVAWPYSTRLVQLLENSIRRAREETLKSFFISSSFILFLSSMFTPVNWIIGSIGYICQEKCKIGCFKYAR